MKTQHLIALLMLTTVGAVPALAAPPPLFVHAHFPGLRPGASPLKLLHDARLAGNKAGAAQASGRSQTLPEQFTIIDAPDAGTGSNEGTLAVFVDAQSRASGYYIDSSDNYHSYFRAADGTFTAFDVNGPDSQTIAHWANDKGSIVGDYFDSNTGQYEGFLRKASGNVLTFDGVEGGSHYTVPASINMKNVTAGYYYGNGYGTDVHAFLRAGDGTLSQFDAPGAGTASFQGTYAQDINGDGVIVGYFLDSNNVYHGFVRSAGGTITVFDVPGAGSGAYQGTQGVGISNRGWITGDFIDSNNVDHGFLRDPAGTITTFDAPDAGTGAYQGTDPIELNNHRNTTGWYLGADDVYHGFLRSKNGAIAEFDAPGAGTGTYLGTSGYDINRYNVVAGWDQDDNGVYHGFLRTP
jgi:hypothetical protein